MLVAAGGAGCCAPHRRRAARCDRRSGGLRTELPHRQLAGRRLDWPEELSSVRLLVDGGVLDNLPTDLLGERAEGPVAAVSIGSGSDGPHRRPGRPRVPALGETLMRHDDDRQRGSGRRRTLPRGAWVVSPAWMGVGLLEFHQLHRMVQAGRAAARALLEQAGRDLGVVHPASVVADGGGVDGSGGDEGDGDPPSSRRPRGPSRPGPEPGLLVPALTDQAPAASAASRSQPTTSSSTSATDEARGGASRCAAPAGRPP